MVAAAIKCCIAYFILSYSEGALLSWQCLTRPIVVAPVIGLLLGDFTTGITMGASLEAIFMGISAIGGSVPSDALTGSIIAVAYTVTQGATAEEGLSISLAIGTVMSSISSLISAGISSPMAPYWENLAQKDIKAFSWQIFAYHALTTCVSTTILFFAVSVGVEGISNALAVLPAWVSTGLSAASSMMIGVGYAILVSMVWDGEIGIFFFVGYVLYKYLGLDTVAIAILGAAIAITMFYGYKRQTELKNELLASGVNTGANTGEEDFF